MTIMDNRNFLLTFNVGNFCLWPTNFDISKEILWDLPVTGCSYQC
jgi:hypothetical protein